MSRYFEDFKSLKTDEERVAFLSRVFKEAEEARQRALALHSEAKALAAAGHEEEAEDLFEEAEDLFQVARPPLWLEDWRRGGYLTFMRSDLDKNPTTGRLYADEQRERFRLYADNIIEQAKSAS